MDMTTPDEWAASPSGPQFHLEHGLGVLEAWSRTASQAARNAVYRALFATLDGSVFRQYRTINSYEDPKECCVYVREDLIVWVRFDDGGFTIDYIGPVQRAA